MGRTDPIVAFFPTRRKEAGKGDLEKGLIRIKLLLRRAVHSPIFFWIASYRKWDFWHYIYASEASVAPFITN